MSQLALRFDHPRRQYHKCYYALNRARMQRLAFYSRERLHQLSAELRLDYDRSEGYMVLLRSDKDRAMVEAGLQVLRDAGVDFRTIDAAQARLIEPALNAEMVFSGAIHLPDDEVANCRQFASLLKAEAQRRYPHLKFTLKTADALLLLAYAQEKQL